MKRCKLLGILCVIALVLVIIAAGCTSPATPTTTPTPTPTTTPPAKVYNLTFANQHPPDNPMNKYIYPGFLREIEQQSGGRIKVTILPASQVAPPPDLFDAARTGIADMSNHMLGATPGRFPVSEVASLPGIVEWPGVMPTSLLFNDLYAKYPEIQAEFAGTKVINFHSAGNGQLYLAKKSVKTTGDLKGLILQVFSPYDVPVVKALGATPETLVITEAYDALAKGVVDGLFTSTEGHIVWSWWDLTKYGVATDMSTFPFVTAMNQKTWDSLPADIQKLFVDGAKRWSTLLAYQFDKDETILRDLINKRMVEKGGEPIYILPEAEKAKWIEAKKAAWEEWVKKVTPKITEAKARAILADAQKLAQQYSYKTYTPTVADAMEKQFKDWGYKFGAFGK